MILKTNKIWMCRDIIWLDQSYGDYKGLTKINETIEHLVDIKQEPNITNTNNEGDDDEDLVESVDDDNESSIIQSTEDDDTVQTGTDEEPMKQSRELVGLRAFNNPGRREFIEFSFNTTLDDSEEPEVPNVFKEAWWHKDQIERKEWRDAVRKEFRDMIKRGVWRKVELSSMPKGRKAVGSKWVFKKKKNGVYRARLVALGYSQIPGVDFTEN